MSISCQLIHEMADSCKRIRFPYDGEQDKLRPLQQKQEIQKQSEKEKELQ